MRKQELQKIIKENVNEILAEEKKKILLEKKVKFLLKEAKKNKKTKVLFEKRLQNTRQTISLLEKHIILQEGLFDSLKGKVKDFFGFTPKEEDQFEVLGGMIDTLENEVREFSFKKMTEQEIRSLSLKAYQLYNKLITSFPEIKGVPVAKLAKSGAEIDKKKRIPSSSLSELGNLKRNVLIAIRQVVELFKNQKAKQNSEEEKGKIAIDLLSKELEKINGLMKKYGEPLVAGQIPYTMQKPSEKLTWRAARIGSKTARGAHSPQESEPAPTISGTEKVPTMGWRDVLTRGLED